MEDRNVKKELSFKPETLHLIYKMAFRDASTKVNKEALLLSSELLRLFVQEAYAQSARQAKIEAELCGDPSSVTVTVTHLEKVLPQLLLDF